jgi:hypothetical protein
MICRTAKGHTVRLKLLHRRFYGRAEICSGEFQYSVSVVTHQRIPVWVKCLYSAFVGAVVPLYWMTYGPWNFLYFCDVALLVTAAALWVESPLLVSMQAVAIVAPQLLWVVDLLFRAVGGVAISGVTGYMLDPNIPLYLRALSLYHGWLPFFCSGCSGAWSTTAGRSPCNRWPRSRSCGCPITTVRCRRRRRAIPIARSISITFTVSPTRASKRLWHRHSGWSG